MDKYKLPIHITFLLLIIVGSILYFYIFNNYQQIFKESWLLLIFMVFVIHVLIELFFRLLVNNFQEKIPHIFKKENSLPVTPMQWKIYDLAMMFFVGMYVLFFVILGLAILVLGGM